MCDNNEFKNPTHITEESIEIYCKGQTSPYYFARHIFTFLRENLYLLEHEDYKRLYDELLEFQITVTRKKNLFITMTKDELIEAFELIADLYNNIKDGRFEKYTKDQVDSYLSHRKRIWESDTSNDS